MSGALTAEYSYAVAMVTSDAGREYRIRNLMDDKGKATRYWTCEECGALVGPLRKYRDAHDKWHAGTGR